MDMKRVVVTGGVGYVGRELVRQLGEAGGSDIHVIDTLACGEHRLAAMDHSKFTLHRIDIRDAEAIKAAMQKIDPQVIYHLAAIHYIPACEAAPGNAVGVNVQGTVNLLDAAPKGARFVFASTAAVYSPSDEAHVETDIGSGPVDIYGITKLHGEAFLRYYHGLGKVDGVIVRLFNVVGPGETNPHLVPAIIAQLMKGETDLRLGNLFPHRDYVDVADVARGFRALAGATAAREAAPLVSNLGTGRTSEVGEVVRLIAVASGLDATITQDPARMRAVDRPMLKASTDKLERLTGWRPQTTVETSMKRAWASRVEDALQ
jgi:UDP-glucose 4-epimerase